MLILAVDPSEINTALVVVGPEGVTANATLNARRALPWLRKLEPIPDFVIIERPALGPGADTKTIGAWEYLSWSIAAMFPDALMRQISPGEWKPIAGSMRLEMPKILNTQHERDAYRMWAWWDKYARH